MILMRRITALYSYAQITNTDDINSVDESKKNNHTNTNNDTINNDNKQVLQRCKLAEDTRRQYRDLIG